MKIAIVGTGVSGLVAAYTLHPHHEITVFESDTRIGGHADTVDVEVDGRSSRSTRDSSCSNDRNYPGFRALLDRLGVATQPTQMSFSVSDPRTGLEFRGPNLNALFAQRRNLGSPSFRRLLAEIARFNRVARPARRRRAAPDRTLIGSPATAGSNTDAEESLADFVVDAGSRNHSCGSSSSRSARRSGPPIRRPSWTSPRGRTRASCTTTDCSKSADVPNGAP